MRLPVNHALSLALVAMLSGGAAAHAKTASAPPPVTGPAADYPVVVGPAFQVGSDTYTPEDRLNYDAVGYAQIAQAGGTAISGAHKTLPLPSYVEVTSLDSGTTILLRVERRGPMNGNLIELSPGAAAQLGVAGKDRPAVRVRRVNPPEQERAMLRSGSRAPERMATPKGLLDALNRKLNGGAVVLSQAGPRLGTPPVAAASPVAVAKPIAAAKPVAAPKPIAAPKPAAAVAAAAEPAPKPKPEPKPSPIAAAPHTPAPGSLIVQVGAFSAPDRAGNVAGKLDGHISNVGRFWRVRMGPFASRTEAEAALAKAKGAGYSDARIQRAD